MSSASRTVAPPTAVPLRRVAAACGAVSSVLAFAGGSLLDHGGKGLSPDESAEVIGAGFAEYAAQARVGASLLLAAVVLGLLFLGPLWSRLRAGSGQLAVIAVAGGAVSMALVLGNAFLGIAAAVAGDLGDGQTARTLLVLEWETARSFAAPSLATVTAAALAAWRYGVLPRSFVWFSLVIAALLALAVLGAGPAGLMGATGFLWVLVLSVVLTLDPVGPGSTADNQRP